MSDDRLNILIISEHRGTLDAAVIRDYLFAFEKYSRHRYYYCHNGRVLDENFDIDQFDAIVLFWSIWALGPGGSVFGIKERLKKSPSPKILFLQDEYQRVHQFNEFMDEIGVNLLFTCVAPSDFEAFYPKTRIPSLWDCHPVLTGYVPSYLESSKLRVGVKPKVDIGYRSRSVRYSLGQLGREKTIIAQRFTELAGQHGFTHDISVREEDRLYGKSWLTFLQSCRFQLGTASGASVIDFDGTIEEECRAYLAINPGAPFEEVRAQVFQPVDGKLVIETISPRLFEYAAVGNIMVLHEGDYRNVVRPDEHFISVKRDYSNLDDVVRRMRDEAFCDRLVRNANRDLIACGKYSYRSIIRKFDAILDAYPIHARNAAASRSRFYLTMARRGQYLIPVNGRDLVLPTRKGIFYLANLAAMWLAAHSTTIGRISRAIPSATRLDALMVHVVGLRAILAFRETTTMFNILWRQWRSRRDVPPEELVREVFLVLRLWYAHTGRSRIGEHFHASLDWDRDAGQLRLRVAPASSYLPLVTPRIVGWEGRHDAFWSALRDDWAAGRLTGIVWHHDEPLSDYIYMRVNNRYWVMLPAAMPERTFRLDTLANYGRDCADPMVALLRIAIEGGTLTEIPIVKAKHFLRATAKKIVLALRPIFRWPRTIVRDNDLDQRQAGEEVNSSIQSPRTQDRNRAAGVTGDHSDARVV